MRRTINKMFPYIGLAIVTLGFLVCLGWAGVSDNDGDMALVTINMVKGLAIVCIGALLGKWRV